MSDKEKTIKERAEEMARELWSEPSMFDATVTALEKLIAENERLKKTIEGVVANIVCGACAEGVFTGAIMAGRKHTCEIGSLQSQLAATQEENERLKKEGNIIADSLSECADKLVIVRGQLAATTAENERLKIGEPYEQPLVDMPMDRQIVMLNRKLAATEARLSEVTSNGWLKHANNCQMSLAPVNWFTPKCTCGLDAFLSTLTAEKKESTVEGTLKALELILSEAPDAEKKEEG